MPNWTWILLCGGLWLATSLESLADEPLGGFPPDVLPELPQAVSTAGLVSLVYPVADLVIEPEPRDSLPATTAVENSPIAVTSHARHETAHQRALQNLAELSMILQSTVVPESWEQTGGAGRIAAHGNTYSLVIRQTLPVQQELADVLNQMRRLNDVEIALTWCEVSTRGADQEPAELAGALSAFHTPLHIQEAWQPLEKLRESFLVQPALEIQLQNGRPANLGPLKITAVASYDHSRVRLLISSPAVKDGLPAHQFYFRLADQRTTLLPINWNGFDGSVRALVTAKVCVPDVAEAPLLPIPSDEEQLAPTPTPADQVAAQPPDVKATPK